nr:immunoglobulin light chain junction region [Macaca mulatta]MOY09796.1 immunoglobulin light chain junction region [Macaca mulatta]MOY10229.1 immunoglobulin light chain junction region [Macaca mulatta]
DYYCCLYRSGFNVLF